MEFNDTMVETKKFQNWLKTTGRCLIDQIQMIYPIGFNPTLIYICFARTHARTHKKGSILQNTVPNEFTFYGSAFLVELWLNPCLFCLLLILYMLICPYVSMPLQINCLISHFNYTTRSKKYEDGELLVLHRREKRRSRRSAL